MTLETVNNVHVLRGTLIIIAGAALLLHTLGLIEQGLSFFLAVVAVSSIIYGMYISGLYAQIRNYWRKNQPTKSE